MPSRLRRKRLDPITLVTELMAIPGRSGHEGQVANRVRRYLSEIGVPASAITTDAAHRKSPIGGECGNLIVRLPGTVKGPRRLMMAHLDTVPLCVGSRPIRQGTKIVSQGGKTALGADNRAGVAVILCAVETLFREQVDHPPLTLFFPVQEEIGLVGARYAGVAKLGRPALCFNWDGGDPTAITVGATGATSMEILVHGIASHAGVHPEQGVSAAAVAARAIADLDCNGWHGKIAKTKRAGTSNIGSITGGEATNVVMPHIRVLAEARSHDPEFRSQIVSEFESAFRRAADEVRNDHGDSGEIAFSAETKYESFRISEDAPAVRAARDAVRQAGGEPRCVVSNGGLDANWMNAHGLPTVTLGCGQHEIHTVRESLDLDEFRIACDIARSIAAGGHIGE